MKQGRLIEIFLKINIVLFWSRILLKTLLGPIHREIILQSYIKLYAGDTITVECGWNYKIMSNNNEKIYVIAAFLFKIDSNFFYEVATNIKFPNHVLYKFWNAD